MTNEEIEEAMKQFRILLHKPNIMISLPKVFEAHLTEEDKKLIEQNHIQLMFS